MITKETTRKLKKTLTIYLAKKAEIRMKESEADALKKELDREFDAVLNQFDDGKLHVSGVGVVSVVTKPARLAWRATGDSLTPAQRAALAAVLPEGYIYEDIDVKRLKEAIDRGDKDLEARLMLEMVKLEQDTRYDVKKL